MPPTVLIYASDCTDLCLRLYQSMPPTVLIYASDCTDLCLRLYRSMPPTVLICASDYRLLIYVMIYNQDIYKV